MDGCKMADNNETFGQRIQRLRLESGITQRDLAGRLKIDYTYLSKLENDRGEPPGEATIRGLAKVLDVEAEELLALAGKLPGTLRERAQDDVQFARLLRRLPSVPDAEMKTIYRRLKIKPPE
jgi:transcriptional regulator with XRE-family HTH domain